ncbi:MAG: hypothetical protein SLAVMIC_00814 [uncultured marine phage]|uniref:Uncharacterized protein n=1 Tax=uncultured marine phage TaxID=707152 RepID=A0A8D9CAN8_9VIRU|nr:MAG: hypothetical protein SLAVMIC_00814 [uncultured marine phage]
MEFEIGEMIITLSRDEVIERYGIDQGFDKSTDIICKVVKKEFISNQWMIQVESKSDKFLSGIWLNQYIFDPYLPLLREKRLKQLLDKP